MAESMVDKRVDMKVDCWVARKGVLTVLQRAAKKAAQMADQKADYWAETTGASLAAQRVFSKADWRAGSWVA